MIHNLCRWWVLLIGKSPKEVNEKTEYGVCASFESKGLRFSRSIINAMVYNFKESDPSIYKAKHITISWEMF